VFPKTLGAPAFHVIDPSTWRPDVPDQRGLSTHCAPYENPARQIKKRDPEGTRRAHILASRAGTEVLQRGGLFGARRVGPRSRSFALRPNEANASIRPFRSTEANRRAIVSPLCLHTPFWCGWDTERSLDLDGVAQSRRWMTGGVAIWSFCGLFSRFHPGNCFGLDYNEKLPFSRRRIISREIEPRHRGIDFAGCRDTRGYSRTAAQKAGMFFENNRNRGSAQVYVERLVGSWLLLVFESLSPLWDAGGLSALGLQGQGGELRGARTLVKMVNTELLGSRT